MKFICEACREGDHEGCRGGTWCDCQHVVRGRPIEHTVVQWQVATVEGHVLSTTFDLETAQFNHRNHPGTRIWCRRVTTHITAWRAVETADPLGLTNIDAHNRNTRGVGSHA